MNLHLDFLCQFWLTSQALRSSDRRVMCAGHGCTYETLWMASSREKRACFPPSVHNIASPPCLWQMGLQMWLFTTINTFFVWTSRGLSIPAQIIHIFLSSRGGQHHQHSLVYYVQGLRGGYWEMQNHKLLSQSPNCACQQQSQNCSISFYYYLNYSVHIVMWL